MRSKQYIQIVFLSFSKIGNIHIGRAIKIVSIAFSQSQRILCREGDAEAVSPRTLDSVVGGRPKDRHRHRDRHTGRRGQSADANNRKQRAADTKAASRQAFAKEISLCLVSSFWNFRAHGSPREPKDHRTPEWLKAVSVIAKKSSRLPMRVSVVSKSVRNNSWWIPPNQRVGDNENGETTNKVQNISMKSNQTLQDTENFQFCFILHPSKEMVWV